MIRYPGLPHHVGIVGAEAAKFTPLGEQEAKAIIIKLLRLPQTVLVSGRCPLGGIDIWAEEAADVLGRGKVIHPPKEPNWERGFGPRNRLIAQDSREVHNIVVDRYPPGFTGRRFTHCYHCDHDRHVKSGGCWTAKQAQRLGKPAFWYVVTNV